MSAAIYSAFLWLEHRIVHRGRKDAERHAAEDRFEYVVIPEFVVGFGLIPIGVYVPYKRQRHVLRDHEHIVRQCPPIGVFEFNSIFN